MIGPVGGALEEEVSSPVVREVIGHLASRAGSCSACTDITSHGGVESISTNDVMEMGGWKFAWLDDGVEALNGQC